MNKKQANDQESNKEEDLEKDDRAWVPGFIDVMNDQKKNHKDYKQFVSKQEKLQFEHQTLKVVNHWILWWSMIIMLVVVENHAMDTMKQIQLIDIGFCTIIILLVILSKTRVNCTYVAIVCLQTCVIQQFFQKNDILYDKEKILNVDYCLYFVVELIQLAGNLIIMNSIFKGMKLIALNVLCIMTIIFGIRYQLYVWSDVKDDK